MKLKYNLLFIGLMLSFSAFGQKKKYPKDLTAYCKITTNKEGENILKCSKLPIDLVGGADYERYEVVAATKDKKKFNVIIMNTSLGDSHIVIYTAEKRGFRWEQKIATSMNVSNEILGVKKDLIECFFPDVNTLFVGYELESGQKKAYLIRLTHRGYRSYKSSFNPAKNSYYYKSEEGTLRPRY